MPATGMVYLHQPSPPPPPNPNPNPPLPLPPPLPPQTSAFSMSSSEAGRLNRSSFLRRLFSRGRLRASSGPHSGAAGETYDDDDADTMVMMPSPHVSEHHPNRHRSRPWLKIYVLRHIHSFPNRTRGMNFNYDGGGPELQNPPLPAWTAQQRANSRSRSSLAGSNTRAARSPSTSPHKEICTDGVFGNGKSRRWLQPRIVDMYRSGASSSNAIRKADSTCRIHPILRPAGQNSIISLHRCPRTSDKD